MKKLMLAVVLAVAVLAVPSSTASAHPPCAKLCPVPVTFPFPCINIPVPKFNFVCDCPCPSWGSSTAWYNHYPAPYNYSHVEYRYNPPAYAPMYSTTISSPYPTPYYWYGR